MKQIFKRTYRYIALLVLVLMAYAGFFYVILFNVTLYPIKWLLSVFYSVELQFNTLFIEEISVEIIPACIAVSAYVLLLILNFSTEMRLKQRIYSLFFSIFCLLLLNISRIVILTILLINNFVYFETVHRAFWYGLSTLFVIVIWFLTVYLFKIKSIPVYTDFMKMKKEAEKK